MSFGLNQKEFEYMQKNIFGRDNSKKKDEEQDEITSTLLKPYQKPKEQGFLSDFVDSVQQGAWQGASDLVRGVNTLIQSDWLDSLADKAAQRADEQLETMSSDMRAALNKSAFGDETGENAGITDMYWWAGNFGAMLGSNLDAALTLGAGKVATTALKQGGKLLSKEAAEEVGKAAIKEATKRGLPSQYKSAVGYAAIIGAMGAGSRDSKIRDELAGYSDEQIAKLEEFKTEYFTLRDDPEYQDQDHNAIFDLAKENFVKKAGRAAALDPTAIAADFVAGGLGGFGGGLGGALSAGKTVARGIAKGAVIEAGTEAMQGAAEQHALNKTAQEHYDPTREVTEGIGRAMAESALLGGTFGGVFGGIDSKLEQRAITKQKRRIVEAVSTGDEKIDAQLRAHAEMANQFANDLDDLIAVNQRVNEWTAKAQSVLEQKAEAERLAEEQRQSDPQYKLITELERFKADGLSNDEIGQFITAKLGALQKHQQDLTDKPFQMTEDYDDSLLKRKAYQEDVTKTKEDLAHWERVRDYWQKNESLVETNNIQPQDIIQNDNQNIVDIRHSFAGEKAQTANHSLLEQAKKAVAQGQDPETVRQQTGWFTGADGKWRFEIDDSQVQLKPEFAEDQIGFAIDPDFEGKTVKLGDLIQAEELFNAYPDLRDIEVNSNSLSGRGSYSLTHDVLSINGNLQGNEAKSTLLHEIQHAIQKREEFARGGSPEEFEDFSKANRYESGNIKLYEEQINNELSNIRNSPEYVQLEQELEHAANNDNWDLVHQLIAKQKELENSNQNLFRLKTLKQATEMRLRRATDPYTAYQSLAGEVEARNVQARMDMSNEQRMLISPKNTQDIDTELQIVRQTGQKAYNLNEDQSSEFAKAVDTVAQGGKPSKQYVPMGTTPDVLKVLGVEDTKVLINRDVLNKVMLNKHNVTSETLKQLPKQINDPVAVMKSAPQATQQGYVVLTELVEENALTGENEPVISALHLKSTKDGMEVINIASVYGKNLRGMQNMLNHDLLYWHKEKGSQFIDAFGLQLPAKIASNDVSQSASDIKTNDDLSQYQSRNSDNKQKAGRINSKLQLLAEDTSNLLFNKASVVKDGDFVNGENSDKTKGQQPTQQIKPTDPEITQAKTLLRKIIGNKLTEQINFVTRDDIYDQNPDMQRAKRSSEGFFEQGKLTIVVDNIEATSTLSRTERLIWVAWHELGHSGITVNFKGRYSAIMQKADRNTVIHTIADRIQEARRGTGDLSEHNRDVAVEEAIVELYSAYETGNYDALRQQYGATIKPLHEKNFRAWFEQLAVQLREFFAKLVGKEKAETFSDAQVFELLKEVKRGVERGTSVNSDIRYSLNEEPSSEFAKQAEPKRRASSFDEARAIVSEFLGKPLVNKATGMVATVSKRSLEKMVSGKAAKQSSSLHDHLMAVANIDSLFENAVNGWTEQHRTNDPNIAGVQRLFAPLLIDGEMKLAKVTVKAMNFDQGNRIYTVETIEVENENGTLGNLEASIDENQHTSPQSANVQSLIQRIKDFNSSDENSDNIRFSRSTSAMQKVGLGKNPSWTEQVKAATSAVKDKPVSEWKGYFTDLGRKANAAIFDALAPLKYFEDEAGITDHTKSAYTAARLAAGSASITEASMLHGLPEFDKDGFVQRKRGTSEKDALVGIMESLGNDVNDFLGWVAGNRAEQLMKEGRENNLSLDDIAELKALNRGKEAKFEAARKKLQAWNTAILDLAEKSGLLSKVERAKFGNNEFYIPFYRENDDGDPISPYRKSGLANQNAGIRKLKGSDKATSDLLGNLISNASKVIDASVKNMAMAKAVTNLADTGVISIIENPTMMDNRSVNKATKEGGRTIVRMDGQEYMVEVHDLGLFNALTNIDQKPLDHPMLKIFSAAKRILTSTVTAMPDFMVRNFLRDIVQAATTDRNSMKLGIDSLKGLKKAYQKDGVAVDLAFTGATFGHGFIDAGDPKAAANKIRKHLRKKGYTKAEADSYMASIIWSKDQLEKAFDKYLEAGSAIENANRIAVYESALANGKSRAQAALEAKDLMDFAMHGNSALIRLLGEVLPFFNARLQGLSQLGRALKDNPRKVAVRGVYIAAASVALAAMNAGNPDYEALPEEEKDNYWHLFMSDQHFRIPKPFEIGVIFGTVPERLFRTTMDYDPSGRFADRVGAALMNTFAFNPMPQLLKPIYEVYSNQNMFTGRPIETMSDQRLSPEARYDERTSLIARGLGSLTGTSPKQIEHLVRGYFGTLGMWVLGAADWGIRTNGNYGELPAQYWNEFPILSAVFGGDVKVPPRYTSQMNDFYRYLNEVNEIAATAKSYKDEGRLQESQQLKQEHARLLSYKPKLSAVQTELRQAKAKIEMIMNDKILTGEQKRARIDKVIAQRNALVSKVVERMRDEDF